MAEYLPRLYGLTGVQGLMAALSIDDVAGERSRSPRSLFRRINTLLKSRIQGRFVDPDLNAVQWIASKLVHDGVVTNAGERARLIDFTTGPTTLMAEGWNELPAGFETEEVRGMIRLRIELLRTMTLSATHRGLIASRTA
jgi:hypothetical protein